LAELGKLGQIARGIPCCVNVNKGIATMAKSDEFTSWEPKRITAERHHVSGRTVDRWIASGRIGPLKTLNGRKYLPAGVVAKSDEA
jgi:hypothetical protein